MHLAYLGTRQRMTKIIVERCMSYQQDFSRITKCHSHGALEIQVRVAACAINAALGIRQHHRFVDIAQEERKGCTRISKKISAMRDDYSFNLIIVQKLFHCLSDSNPMFAAHAF